MLRLADVLGIARVPEVVCPRATEPGERPTGPYAVIHAAPMFRYKQWTARGWLELADALAARGLTVIATGGPAEAERRYLDEVWSEAAVMRRDGQLAWPQLAGLLSQARVYVGPDTSVTHLAAAAGCPTVATLWADRSEVMGALAGGRHGRELGGIRHHSAPRQCLAGAKSAAVHAMPARGVRAAAR